MVSDEEAARVMRSADPAVSWSGEPAEWDFSDEPAENLPDDDAEVVAGMERLAGLRSAEMRLPLRSTDLRLPLRPALRLPLRSTEMNLPLRAELTEESGPHRGEVIHRGNDQETPR